MLSKFHQLDHLDFLTVSVAANAVARDRVFVSAPDCISAKRATFQTANYCCECILTGKPPFLVVS
jgi:hypothetical protein